MNPKIIAKKILPRPVRLLLRGLITRCPTRNYSKSVSVSQAGQDYWVYGEAFNEKPGGFFLDIGAHDGRFLSNTFILEKRYNWRGICIEGNPETYIDLKRNRSCECINICIDSKQGVVEFALRGMMGGIVAEDVDNIDSGDNVQIKVDALPLVDLLNESNAPRLIDYLSIDIEGAEDRALLGFPFSDYVFNCITIERPSDELRRVLLDHEYILIKEIPGLDCFYIHKSFSAQYNENLFAFGMKRFLIKRWI